MFSTSFVSVLSDFKIYFKLLFYRLYLQNFYFTITYSNLIIFNTFQKNEEKKIVILEEINF